jgi:hypothetical protein
VSTLIASGCPSDRRFGDELAFRVAVRFAAPAARVTGSAADLAAAATFFVALAPVRFVAAFVPAAFRRAADGARDPRFDVLDDFFVGAMTCSYPALHWRNQEPPDAHADTP